MFGKCLGQQFWDRNIRTSVSILGLLLDKSLNIGTIFQIWQLSQCQYHPDIKTSCCLTMDLSRKWIYDTFWLTSIYKQKRVSKLETLNWMLEKCVNCNLYATNQPEKHNYNQNLVQFDKLLNKILCVFSEWRYQGSAYNVGKHSQKTLNYAKQKFQKKQK